MTELINNKKTVDLKQLFNLDELKKVFQHFSVTTRLGVALFDVNGEVLLSNLSDKCLCYKQKIKEKCKKAIAYGGKKSAQLGEPYIFSCGCGLIMSASPVIFDGEQIGSIVCGPAMLWEKDDFAVGEIKFNTAGLGITSEEIAICVESAVQLECVNINSAAQILFLMVGALCRDQSNSLKQQAEINRQQARIGELIAAKKSSGEDSYQKSVAAKVEEIEKDLIVAMQLGDNIKARMLLNALLAEIFSIMTLDNIRIKIYELTAVLARAAMDAGAPLEALSPIIKKSAQILSDSTDFETLCYLTSEILESFMAAVYKYRAKKTTGSHLSRALAYINKNYAEELSLEVVASKIFVSTYYLSHLFRDEMNMTFLDYVTKARIENAKRLLKTDISTADVAASVGYSDSSYFSKAFKKETGFTPAQYRKMQTGE